MYACLFLTKVILNLSQNLSWKWVLLDINNKAFWWLKWTLKASKSCLVWSLLYCTCELSGSKSNSDKNTFNTWAVNWAATSYLMCPCLYRNTECQPDKLFSSSVVRNFIPFFLSETKKLRCRLTFVWEEHKPTLPWPMSGKEQVFNKSEVTECFYRPPEPSDWAPRASTSLLKTLTLFLIIIQ